MHIFFARAAMVPTIVAAVTAVPLFASASQALEPDAKGYIFIAGLLSGPKNYEPYIKATGATQDQTLFLEFDQSPFSANHVRDYAKMNLAYEQLEARSPGGVVLFGFSAGSKFAFKLAQDHSTARALFLLDPVDGGPPIFSNNKTFPDFANSTSYQLSIPTVFLETEFGPKMMMGLACVPAKKGPDHYAPHFQPAHITRIFLPGAGHPDFLYPPVNPLAKMGCGKSQVDSQTVRAQTLSVWNDFLAKL